MELTAAPFTTLTLPPVPVPGRWTFWADTIVGAVPLGPVSVSAFTCQMLLSGFGTGSVNVELPCGVDTSRILRLWSWRLWAMYEGVPVWCGVPTGITDTGLSTVTLTLTELPGYLAKRLIDVYPSQVFTQAEQCAIASWIAQPLADVGVTVITAPGAGYKRDRTLDFLSSNRADELTGLAQLLDGPEFRAEYSMSGGRPHCTLRIAYPRVGSGGAGLGVNVGPSAIAYQAQWDADQLRTRTYATGALPANAAEGTPQPVIMADLPQSDLPRLDVADDWSNTVMQTSLIDRAETSSTQQAAPALVLTVTPSEASYPISAYGPGDDVTCSITTPLLPDGYTLTARLNQIDVDAAAATAQWTMSAISPPPRARESLGARLHRIDGMQRQMFRNGPLNLVSSSERGSR